MTTSVSAEALEKLAEMEKKVAEMVQFIKDDDSPERIATTLAFLWAKDIMTLDQRGLFVSMFLIFNLAVALASEDGLADKVDEIKRHISRVIGEADDKIHAELMKTN